MAYWLIKSNPKCFSINDLERLGTEMWDGVRNYRARNFMRDDMKVGDSAFFYHSSAKPSGVAACICTLRPAARSICSVFIAKGIALGSGTTA